MHTLRTRRQVRKRRQARPLTVRLLALYPLSWRERYGDELAELLANEPVRPAAILYVLAGALDAQLHRGLVAETIPSVNTRLRATMLTSFCAVVGFAVAALAFVEAVNDLAFAQLIRGYPQFRGTWSILTVGGLITLATVLVGSLPILVAVTRDAWAGHRRDLRLFLVPPLAAVVLSGCDAFEELRRAYHVVLSQPIGLLLDVSFHLLFVLGVSLSTRALCILVLRSTIPTRLIRFALVPAAVAALSMSACVGATVVWLVQVNSLVPDRLGASLVGIGFASLILVSAASTILVAGAVLRALVLPSHQQAA